MTSAVNIAVPSIRRCVLGLALPWIIMVVGFTISVATGVTDQQYSAALARNPILQMKRDFNMAFGGAGMLIWMFLIYPPAIRSIIKRSSFLRVENGDLICFGNSVCPVSMICDVEIEKKFLQKTFIVRLRDGSVRKFNYIFADNLSESDARYIMKLQKGWSDHPR
jgi:hypothetical protein